MATEEARRVVKAQATGEGSYRKAVEALINNYGHPRKVYPYHVRSLVHHRPYSYDRECLRRLRETIEINMRGFQCNGGDTLEQFVMAIVTELFDDRLREEWIKHTASMKLCRPQLIS